MSHDEILGFGEVTGDAEIAFWTGILGKYLPKADKGHRG